MVHGFEFNVVAEHATSLIDWQAKARRIEALGYTALLIPDHMNIISPVVMLTAAALATSRLKIGAAVINNDLYNPVVLARDFAYLSLIAGDRVELGMGAGYLDKDYQACGVTLERPGIRLRRLEEALQIIKACFARQTIDLAGEFYQIHTDTATFMPEVSTPRIYLGGGGLRALSLAVKEADIVGVVPPNTSAGIDLKSATSDKMDEKISLIQKQASDLKKQILLSTMVFHVSVLPSSKERYAVAQRVTHFFEQRFHQRLSADEVLEFPHVLIGSVEDVCANLLERRERFGISHINILEKDMEVFAPVVQHLSAFNADEAENILTA